MEAQGRASLLAPMAETHLWRQIFRSQFQATPPSHGSWEEKAFAEDTAGPLGGSVWPPRSYSCNFCMREFRSAQALGGHMNVHRRDRARLQQSIIGSHVENLHDQNDPNRPFTTGRIFTSSTARVSMNQSEWADAVGFKVVGGLVGKKQEEGGYSSSSPRLPGHDKPADFNLETDPSVKNRSASGFCGDEAKILSSKRAKVSVSSVSSCSDIYRSNTISGSSEELDLELRLGSDPPKVN